MNFHAAKAYILDRLERQLSDQLTYHSLSHTLDVFHTTDELCDLENINPYERLLLKTAALYHDSGFLIDNVNHEELGCQIVQEHLPRYRYTNGEIKTIQSMIMATKIPQSPKNHLEQVLCDADLDYLGRKDFYGIGNTLFQELKAYNVLQDKIAWNKLQVKFIEAHNFFTSSNQYRREQQKQEYLQQLREWLARTEASQALS
jgi:predicted metal-dependent HD superfamily phosphohydrolase